MHASNLHEDPATTKRWSHQDTLHALGIPAGLYDQQMCNGAIIGVNSYDWRAMKNVIEPVTSPDRNSKVGLTVGMYQMYACAMSRQCIAPLDSSRLNHRQDRTVLTGLMRKHGFGCHWHNAFPTQNPLKDGVTISIQNDVKGEGSRMCKDTRGDLMDCNFSIIEIIKPSEVFRGKIKISMRSSLHGLHALGGPVT